jgi:hypothetical protein
MSAVRANADQTLSLADLRDRLPASLPSVSIEG